MAAGLRDSWVATRPSPTKRKRGSKEDGRWLGSGRQTGPLRTGPDGGRKGMSEERRRGTGGESLLGRTSQGLHGLVRERDYEGDGSSWLGLGV